MVKEPPKQLRWERVIIALVLLAGLVGGAIYLVTK